ncbi:MAG: DUF2075 domain-containing protein [Bacteroidales bacterium]|nr:DUF2075 domain-containing protein [Bacteroidales bacterium]
MKSRHIIYSESQEVFYEEVLRNRVAPKMREAYEHYGSTYISDSEYRSWQNSPRAVKNLMELSGISDAFVTFEYLVPYTQKRIDCLLYGRNADNKGYVVHIELKQWDSVRATNIEGNFIETYTGRPGNRVPHPSQQVKGYHDYLTGFVRAFEINELGLFGCAYCHNYEWRGDIGLYDPVYHDIIREHPVYAGNQIEDLAEKLRSYLSHGDGIEVFNKFLQSPVYPSKKLMESATRIVSNKSDFSLIDEQIVARNTIISKIRNARKNGEKSVILIKGGPGTGKTVIALHVLAEIAADKYNRSVFFATKSKPLLEGIKNRLGRGNNARLLFTNLNQFIPSRVEEDSVDVLIIDEAHRIGKTSNSQFTRSFDRTDMAQVETLVRAAKTSVFFIDDKQVIRSREIGNTGLIRQFAEKYNCSIEEVELVSQFRCNGSDNYLDWVEKVLENDFDDEPPQLDNSFDFRVMDSPQELYDKLVELNQQESITARLTAGFCWEWSKKLDENGELVKDVRIGDFAMPWETHGDIGTPPFGYVKWYEWAYKPEGIKQVGCIYTAQGFEFDYIGVIIGGDLKYNPYTDQLETDISATRDPVLRRGRDKFDGYVRNIYRVLMTRGLRGCYIYCTDKATSAYFKRMSKREQD